MKTLLIAFVVVALLAPAGLAEEQPQPQVPPEPGMVERALAWIGVQYRFGGQDEKKGFDCAGLVRRVFSTAAISLPRTAAAQFRHGSVVERNDLQPGDLVFFRNTYKPGISHVGIYVGGGEFVHAASRRRSVVVDKLDASYYSSRFAGGRRVLPPTIAPPLPAQLAISAN